MPEFTGNLRLASDPTTSVAADVVVEADRLVLNSGASQIGDWKRKEVDIDVSAEGFRLRADGEDLILDVTDPDGFAAAVGIPAFEPRRDDPVAAGPRRAKSSKGKKGRGPFPTADSLSSRFSSLRQRSAAGYDDDSTMRRSLVSPLLASAVLVALGALLGWGPYHLIGDTTFPFARVVAGVAAVAAAVGIYLASRRHQRASGVPVIAAAAVLSLLALYAYANEAGLRIGFLVSFLGVAGLGALGVVAMTGWGATPRNGPTPEEDGPER
jgi:hypothetical protein